VAGPNQSDQLAELSLALLDVYKATGLVRQRVGWFGDGLGRIAKQAGTDAETVQAWLTGELQPLPGQALAIVRALRLAGEPGVAAAALNGKEA
jgi:hypothetical protein